MELRRTTSANVTTVLARSHTYLRRRNYPPASTGPPVVLNALTIETSKGSAMLAKKVMAAVGDTFHVRARLMPELAGAKVATFDRSVTYVQVSPA